MRPAPQFLPPTGYRPPPPVCLADGVVPVPAGGALAGVEALGVGVVVPEHGSVMVPPWGHAMVRRGTQPLDIRLAPHVMPTKPPHTRNIATAFTGLSRPVWA